MVGCVNSFLFRVRVFIFARSRFIFEFALSPFCEVDFISNSHFHLCAKSIYFRVRVFVFLRSRFIFEFALSYLHEVDLFSSSRFHLFTKSFYFRVRVFAFLRSRFIFEFALPARSLQLQYILIHRSLYRFLYLSLVSN